MQRILYWLVGVFFFFPVVAWGEFLAIDVRHDALVQGPEITLGDVADIRGGLPRTAARVRSIVIAQSPPAGEMRILRGQYIATRLKQHGIQPPDVQIHTPDRVQVTRAFQRIEPRDIEAAVKHAITAHMPWPSHETTIREVRGIEPAILPTGTVQYDVTFPTNTNFLGPTSFTVMFRVAGNMEKRMYGTADMEVMQHVVTTTRPIPRHSVLTTHDLHLTRVTMARTPRRVMTNLDDVIGKRARRALAANATVHTYEVETLPVVRKGDAVLLIVESPLLKITTIGEALEPGKRGATIRVRNVSSNREVRAVVIDEKTVRIPF